MPTLNPTPPAAHRLLITAALMALPSCLLAEPDTGEQFRLGIARHMSTPDLIEGRLSSSEKNPLVIERPGNFYSYFTEDKIKIPETFVLHWRAKGDLQSQEKVFTVRSKLPTEVIKKLQSSENQAYLLSLNFRVENGLAECLWALSKLDKNSTLVQKGVIR